MSGTARDYRPLVFLAVVEILIGCLFFRRRIAQTLMEEPQAPWSGLDTGGLVVMAIVLAVGVGTWIWAGRD